MKYDAAVQTLLTISMVVLSAGVLACLIRARRRCLSGL